MDWPEVQDAVLAALSAGLDGWHVAPEVGFPGMDALDAYPGGLVWVDSDFETATFSGVMAGPDGGITPVGIVFPVTVNGYCLKTTITALRGRVVELEADLLAILTGATFVAEVDALAPTGRSLRTGIADERNVDGLYTLTLTFNG